MRQEENPISVVGIACRFPRANGVDAFWDLLISGRDATSELPQERWPLADLLHEDRKAVGTIVCPRAGLLDNIKGFDARFFGITPREAEAMDPQQRIALEVAYEALEDAGIVTGAPQRTGVFVGAWSAEYSRRFHRNMPNETLQYWGTGNSLSVIANRISYAFNFRGTSMTLDTASSSSLLAVHVACRAIEAGDIDRAVVGGVNLLIDPITSVYFTKIGALSPDGLSKSFDADANGYVRAEGCGFVVLERTRDAEARRQRVYAEVLGTGSNQDGRSPGLTVPNGEAQAELIRETLARANLEAGAISYVESHASGTPVGDPIEMAAIGEAYKGTRLEPLRIGSVKSNIGHLEAAAGIAGFIKTVLSIERGELPPTLHFQSPNKEIHLEHFEMRVQNTHTTWPKTEKRIAAVNSFGLGGTNVHVLVGHVNTTNVIRDAVSSPLPLVLTARSENALKDHARQIAAALRKNTPPGASLADVAGTLTTRRTHHDHRLVAIGRARDEWAEKLEAFVEGGAPELFAVACRKGQDRARRIAFVFSGQGAHWIGMGRQLYVEDPAFRRAFDQVSLVYRELTDHDLSQELHSGTAARLERLDIVQPLVFALNLSLVAVLGTRSVRPDVVLGHSQGEVAAAVVSGILSLRDGCRVMMVRSALLESMRGKGHMAVIGISEREADQHCREFGNDVSVAAINGPRTVVVSGRPEEVTSFVHAMTTKGLFAKILNAGWAAHHRQMDSLREKLLEGLGAVTWSRGSVPFVSTATAGEVAAFGPEYWWENLRNPVQFYAAIDSLADEATTFLEIGPHPGLRNAIVETIRTGKRSSSYVATLQRDTHEPAEMLRAAAELFTLGHRVDWSHWIAEEHRSAPLPSYPWEHNDFWIPLQDAVSLAARSSLESRPPSMLPSSSPADELSFIATIRSTPRNERTNVARSHVAEVVYRLAKLGRRKGDLETPLKTLGFDSILFRTLEGELEDELGVTSSAALLMSYGTIAGISDALLEQIFSSGPTSMHPEDAPTLTSLEAILALDKVLEGLE